MRRRLLNGDRMSEDMTDLPLLYEHTLTERVVHFDTGQNAFRCEKRIIVEIIIPKDTDGTGTTGMFMVGSHTENTKIDYPWHNGVLDRGGSIELESIYGLRLIIDAFKISPDTRWISRKYYANFVNTNGKDEYVVNSGGLHDNEAITGLLIGNNKSGGNKTLTPGTIIKVWGI